jgi:hypothetical protein
MMSGYFNLQIGGQNINSYNNPKLPYNINAANLQNAFRNIVGF